MTLRLSHDVVAYSLILRHVHIHLMLTICQALKKIESGEIGTFDSLLRVLRTLGMLENISTLFEEEQMSPSEYYEMINKAPQTRSRTDQNR